MIYKNDVIVWSNDAARQIYRNNDWSKQVSFDECFRDAIERGRIADPVILADPEGHLAFAKAARSRGINFQFRRQYDNCLYDRYHVGHDNMWNAQVWFQAKSSSVGSFVLEPINSYAGLQGQIKHDQATAVLPTILERMGIAAAILSSEGRVIDCSTVMAELFAAGTPVVRNDDGIVSVPVVGVTSILHRAIQMVAEGQDHAVVVPVRMNDGEHQHIGLLSPESGAGVAVMVISMFPRQEALSRVLETAYGLGQREAEVAARLARGDTPDEIASSTGRSEDTIRAHIKSIKKKIAAGRQHNLAHIITRAAALVGGIRHHNLRSM